MVLLLLLSLSSPLFSKWNLIRSSLGESSEGQSKKEDQVGSSAGRDAALTSSSMGSGDARGVEVGSI